MITRKITYKGNFNTQAASEIYNITRTIEITGEVKANGNQEVILNLEGDPSMIKLIQHRIERSSLKSVITDKTVEAIPFQYYKGLFYLA